LNIEEKNGIYKIEDTKRNISCTYDGNKLSGLGSRKNKDEILSQVDDYKSVIDKIEIIGEPLKSKDDDYREIASLSSFVNSFNPENVRTSTVTLEDIKKWESNPIKYAYQLYKYSLYLMGENGLVARTIDMFTNLHGLSSSLEYTNPEDENFEKDLESIRRYDSYINKETVIRDIIRESTHGTYIGLIIRKRFIQSLDIELYTPTTMIDGYFNVRCDLLNLTTAGDNRSIYDYPNEYQNKSYNPNEEVISRQPDIVQLAFRNWASSKGERYYDLPIEQTVVIKYSSLQQERFGRPYVMPVMKELLHKDLLKMAEEVLIDRLIHSVYVLTLGEKGEENKGSFKPTSKQRRTIGTAVKGILNKDNSGDDNVKSLIVGLPWWAEMKEVSVNLELFKTKKYEEVNLSIAQGLAVSDIFGANDSGSYASASVAVDIFMKNILSIISQIEDQVFNKQYRLMTTNMNNIFYRKFSRGTVVLGDQKIELLKHLLSIGGSVKYVLDEIGINYQDYIKQIKAEKDEDKLHELFEPYRTSSTMSSNENGRPDEGGNSTENQTPSPSD